MTARASVEQDQRFQPTIASLLDYQCPQWFRGRPNLYCLHWGVYAWQNKGSGLSGRCLLFSAADYASSRPGDGVLCFPIYRKSSEPLQMCARFEHYSHM